MTRTTGYKAWMALARNSLLLMSDPSRVGVPRMEGGGQERMGKVKKEEKRVPNNAGGFGECYVLHTA